MTHAERQARYRAKQAVGAPTFRYRKPVDRRSRLQRWRDVVAELQELQDEYQTWLDALPQNMADSGMAEALQWHGRGLARDLRPRPVRTREHR
jgi:hypothetical protein